MSFEDFAAKARSALATKETEVIEERLLAAASRGRDLAVGRKTWTETSGSEGRIRVELVFRELSPGDLRHGFPEDFVEVVVYSASAVKMGAA